MLGLSRLDESPEGCGLWLVDLSEPIDAAAQRWLDSSELARARRFVFEKDRRRYLAAHVALRHVLSHAIGVSPATVQIGAGRYGKPRLTGHSRITFNLSHSEDVALIGIGQDMEIGVDIEVMKPVPQSSMLALDHFSGDEREAFNRCSSDQADVAFLQIWTRKEACLKAIGWGLNVASLSFHVGVGSTENVVEVPTEQGPVSVSVKSLRRGYPYVAAFARVLDGPSCP